MKVPIRVGENVWRGFHIEHVGSEIIMKEEPLNISSNSFIRLRKNKITIPLLLNKKFVYNKGVSTSNSNNGLVCYFNKKSFNPMCYCWKVVKINKKSAILDVEKVSRNDWEDHFEKIINEGIDKCFNSKLGIHLYKEYGITFM